MQENQLNDLKEIAIDALKASGTKMIIICEDGNAFSVENINAFVNHISQNKMAVYGVFENVDGIHQLPKKHIESILGETSKFVAAYNKAIGGNPDSFIDFFGVGAGDGAEGDGSGKATKSTKNIKKSGK
jgi:hypothetical protein